MTVPSDRILDPSIVSSTDEDFYTMTVLMLGPKIDHFYNTEMCDMADEAA